jgi:hypothetical protein
MTAKDANASPDVSRSGSRVRRWRLRLFAELNEVKHVVDTGSGACLDKPPMTPATALGFHSLPDLTTWCWHTWPNRRMRVSSRGQFTAW